MGPEEEELYGLACMDMPVGGDEVREALDKFKRAYAHELAEKQRESARAAYSRVIAVKGVDLAAAWILGHDRAADLIDPEVSK